MAASSRNAPIGSTPSPSPSSSSTSSDWGEASGILEALRLDPNEEPDLVAARGRLRFATGRDVEAAEDLASIDPRAPWVAAWNGRDSTAIERILEGGHARGELAAPPFGPLAALATLSDEEGLEPHLVRVVKRDPSAVVPRLRLLRILPDDRRQALLEELSSKWEGLWWIHLERLLLAIDEDDATGREEALVRLAECVASSDSLGDVALARLERRLGEPDQDEPTDGGVTDRARVDLRWCLARLQLFAGDVSPALEHLEALVEAAHGDPVRLHRVGMAYHEAEMWNSAYEYLSQASLLDRDRAETRLLLADACRMVGEGTRARDLLVALQEHEDDGVRTRARIRWEDLPLEVRELEGSPTEVHDD